MKFGIVALAHNAYPDIERFALSMHNQVWPDWMVYIIDANSDDHLAKLTWPFNKLNDCGVLKDRFRPCQIDGIDPKLAQEDWQRFVRDLLNANPMCGAIAFCSATMRLHFKLLTSVQKFFTSGIDVVQVEAKEHKGDATTMVSFVRREVVQNYPPTMEIGKTGPIKVRYAFGPEVRHARLGRMEFIDWFKKEWE